VLFWQWFRLCIAGSGDARLKAVSRNQQNLPAPAESGRAPGIELFGAWQQAQAGNANPSKEVQWLTSQ
jgi:hypothetical protein